MGMKLKKIIELLSLHLNSFVLDLVESLFGDEVSSSILKV
jgi:hypothetical protein